MLSRPLAAHRLRPIHKTVIRRNTEMDVISVLTEGEPLSVRAMKRPLKVLKDAGAKLPGVE